MDSVKKDNILLNSYFLTNEKNQEMSVNGRLYFDYVVLSIHKDKTEYQENHICWLEENVVKNLQSAQNMPMVAQFIDSDKSEPLGHGYLTKRNGRPVVVDSEQVGSTVKAEIKNVDVGGETIRALVATAYLNELRYPQLCQWVKSKMFDKEPIATSVEIFAKKGNENIVAEYLDTEDGEICVPIDFDFGSSAILTVTPGDENAIVLEIFNSLKEINKSEINIDNKKEEEIMDKNLESLTNELATVKTDKASLEAKLTEKDALINELTSEKEALETQVSELTTEKETLETEKTELETANAELVEFKEGVEKEELIENFDKEIKEFDEELVSEVKDEIEDFKAEPTAEKSEAIVNSLNALFVKKAKEVAVQINAKKEAKDEFKINSLFVAVENKTSKDENKEFKVFE